MPPFQGCGRSPISRSTPRVDRRFGVGRATGSGPATSREMTFAACLLAMTEPAHGLARVVGVSAAQAEGDDVVDDARGAVARGLPVFAATLLHSAASANPTDLSIRPFVSVTTTYWSDDHGCEL